MINITNYDANNSKPKHKSTTYTKDQSTGKITKNVTDHNANTINISCKPGYINADGGPNYTTPKCKYEDPNTEEPPRYELIRCIRRGSPPGSPIMPISPVCPQGQSLIGNTCR